MASTAYCETTDLLTGNIPLPAYVDAQKYVDDAGDEIDSYLGARYVTPIVLDPEADITQRPAKLMLKRINTFLASGRLILATAAGGEDTELHAYGWSLVRDATAALKSLVAGEPILTGALPNETAGGSPMSDVPLISNGDPYSQVDAFYEVVTPGQTSVNPLGYLPLDRRVGWHG